MMAAASSLPCPRCGHRRGAPLGQRVALPSPRSRRTGSSPRRCPPRRRVAHGCHRTCSRRSSIMPVRRDIGSRPCQILQPPPPRRHSFVMPPAPAHHRACPFPPPEQFVRAPRHAGWTASRGGSTPPARRDLASASSARGEAQPVRRQPRPPASPSSSRPRPSACSISARSWSSAAAPRATACASDRARAGSDRDHHGALQPSSAASSRPSAWRRSAGTGTRARRTARAASQGLERVARTSPRLGLFYYNDSECLDAEAFVAADRRCSLAAGEPPYRTSWLVDVVKDGSRTSRRRDRVEERAQGDPVRLRGRLHGRRGRRVPRGLRRARRSPRATSPTSPTAAFNCAPASTRPRASSTCAAIPKQYRDWGDDWCAATDKESELPSPSPSTRRLPLARGRRRRGRRGDQPGLVHLKGFDACDVKRPDRRRDGGPPPRGRVHPRAQRAAARLRGRQAAQPRHDDRRARLAQGRRPVQHDARGRVRAGAPRRHRIRIFPEFVDSTACCSLPTTGRFFHVPLGALRAARWRVDGEPAACRPLRPPATTLRIGCLSHAPDGVHGLGSARRGGGRRASRAAAAPSTKSTIPSHWCRRSCGGSRGSGAACTEGCVLGSGLGIDKGQWLVNVATVFLAKIRRRQPSRDDAGLSHIAASSRRAFWKHAVCALTFYFDGRAARSALGRGQRRRDCSVPRDGRRGIERTSRAVGARHSTESTRSECRQ